MGVQGQFLKKINALYAELKERAKADISSYYVRSDFSQDIYSVSVTKNHQNTLSRCLVHEFTFKDIFQRY